MTDKKFEPVDLTLWIILAGFLLFVVAVETYANDDDDCRQGDHQCGYDVDVDVGGQDQHQDQSQEQSAEASVTDSSVVDQQVTFTSPRRAPTNFLYMQNQVEACGRTFGFSGSNTSGGWAFGIPIPRSWTPTCDLWKAAEEAQQNGFVFTSYMFQCSIKAVRKVLGTDTCGKFENMAMVEMGFIDPPPDLTEIYNRAAKYDERWLMADVTQEEYEEQQELVEYRQSQQQNLIESQQQTIEEQGAEIEELQQREAREAARRAAARAALEKKDET